MAFSAQILIDSSDYYTQITGQVSVQIEEGAARLASFVLDPLPGAVDPYAWIGKSVVINYRAQSSDAWARLFTGGVHTVDYDIAEGVVRFTCTDNLQEAFESISRPAIDALTSMCAWSDKLFSAARDKWDYVQQRMSTYPGSLDKSPSGVLRVTDWAAKTTPDHTYTDATIDSGTLRIEQLAERRNIVNSVKITYTSVFQGLRQRESKVEWAADYGSLWQEWLSNPFYLPERQAIESALSDWTLKSIEYDPVLPSGEYGGINWIATDYSDALCLGFRAWLAIRWRRDIALEYTVTVGNAVSQSAHGLLESEQSYSVDHKTRKGDDWTHFEDYQLPAGDMLYGSLPFGDRFEWQKTTQGDDSLPQFCAVSIARTKLLQSHRQNRISFECALNGAIDVSQTVKVEHTKLLAKGKVYGVEHIIDVLEGFATTRCTVAITLPSQSGQTNDSIARATMPYFSLLPDYSAAAPPNFPALGQHLGNIDDAPVEDQSWIGLISNYQTWSGFATEPPPLYDPVRFVVTTPAIDDTDYNVWLNDESPLTTKLIKDGSSHYQRVLFGNEPLVVGDELHLYDGDDPVSVYTLIEADLALDHYDFDAPSSRQDEHAITQIMGNTAINVALPVDILEITK